MGYERTAYGHHTIGDLEMKKPAIGSIGLSEASLDFVKQYIGNEKSDVLDYVPFPTITSAFVFFFSLGYELEEIRQESSTSNIARGFNFEIFEELVVEDALSMKKSLGATISGYAEGGIAYIQNQMKKGNSLESFLKGKFGE